MFLKNACDIEFKVVVDEKKYDVFTFHTFIDAKRFCYGYYYKDEKIKRLDIDVVLSIFDNEDKVIESFYYTREDWEKEVEEASERLKMFKEF